MAKKNITLNDLGMMVKQGFDEVHQEMKQSFDKVDQEFNNMHKEIKELKQGQENIELKLGNACPVKL